MQRTRKGRKVRTEGPIIFHMLYFVIQIIIAACNSVYEMNQTFIFKNIGNEIFWKAEADRSSKYKNWWAVAEWWNSQVWSNASWIFQTNFEPINEQFYSLPNNKSTPGYTVRRVPSYVEANDPNDNWCLINQTLFLKTLCVTNKYVNE